MAATRLSGLLSKEGILINLTVVSSLKGHRPLNEHQEDWGTTMIPPLAK